MAKLEYYINIMSFCPSIVLLYRLLLPIIIGKCYDYTLKNFEGHKDRRTGDGQEGRYILIYHYHIGFYFS